MISLGAQLHANLAVYDPITRQLAPWQASVSGSDGFSVNALVAQGDTIYAGGWL